jgi:hypothetical protein
LRLTPTPLHGDREIDALIASLTSVWSRVMRQNAA